MNRAILGTIILLMGLFQLGCSCDSVKGGFVIITQSLPDGEVGKQYSALLEAREGYEPWTWSVESGAGIHLLTKNGLLTRWFVFGVMNTNPSGNSYTILAPEPSAFMAYEEYVLFGMVAKTGPPNSSAENNPLFDSHRITKTNLLSKINQLSIRQDFGVLL